MKTKIAYQIVSGCGMRILGSNLRTHRSAQRILQVVRKRFDHGAFLAALSVNSSERLRGENTNASGK